MNKFEFPWIKIAWIVGYVVFEYWAGRTKKVKGNSLLEILQNAGIKLLKAMGLLR